MLSLNNNYECLQCLVSALFQKSVCLFKVSTKRPIPVSNRLIFSCENLMLHQKKERNENDKT